MSTKIRLLIRGFATVRRQLVFEDQLELTPEEIETLLPALAEKHGKALASHALHMIEIEFLDESDPKQRFFRFGTDPGGMVLPVKIDL